MPPKARTRTRSGSASTTERVTRSQARSDTSHEGSEIGGTEDRRASGALKPDVKSEVSLAYGSPQRNKVPNRLASKIRERNIEGLIEDAVEESANVVVQTQDRDVSVAGTRLSDIEEGNTEDESTVHGSPSKRGPIGHSSISFNVEAPVGRSAGFDENGHQGKPDQLNARNLRRINRDSSTDSDDYVEKMIEQISSSHSIDPPSRFSFNNLTKLLLLGSLLAACFLALLGTNGISNAASHITQDLKAQVHGILSPAPPGSFTPDSLRPWVRELNTQVNIIANDLRRLSTRHGDLESRVGSQHFELNSRVNAIKAAAEKREHILDPGVNAFAVGSGLLVDPYLTSPTKRVQEKYWLGPLLRAFLGAPVTRPQTPYAAFQPWDDHGDCWCAAAAEGHAQISVILPRGVAPKKLVIEHISDRQTPDPGATPKEFELWVQIGDEELREHIELNSRFKYGPPQERHTSLAALKDNWVRVLAGTFDGRSLRRKQEFYLPDYFRPWRRSPGVIYPRRFTLRINSLWGPDKDHACLYRVKLFGDSPDYEEIYNERDLADLERLRTQADNPMVIETVVIEQ